MRRLLGCFAIAIVPASLSAQVPAGWKVVKSPQRLTRTASPNDRGGGGACRMAVPPDWKVDTQADKTEGQTGHMISPDGNISTSIQEHPPGQTLARAKEVALMFNKDAKVREESATRVWLTYNRAFMTIWDVLVAGDPVCEAQIILNSPGASSAAQKIVPTVGPAK